MRAALWPAQLRGCCGGQQWSSPKAGDGGEGYSAAEMSAIAARSTTASACSARCAPSRALTDFIHMGKLHDLSSYTREDVVVEFAEIDKQALRTPIPLWMERNAGRIPWVKEEYDRVKAGKLATTGGDIPHVK
jgi:hypothetical protein